MTIKEKPLPSSEAQNLMPRNALSAAIEKLNDSIRKAAARDETQVRIDWLCDIKGDKCELTELGRRTVKMFEAQGYSRRDVYECRQFVDIGMALTWSPNPKK